MRTQKIIPSETASFAAYPWGLQNESSVLATVKKTTIFQQLIGQKNAMAHHPQGDEANGIFLTTSQFRRFVR